MLQYKTTCIPEIVCRGVKAREFKKGLTLDTMNKAVTPIGQAIEAEARGGWALHSIDCLPQKVARKKTIFEFLLGWIPLLGNWIFPNMYEETKEGVEYQIYILVFVKDI